MNLQKKQNTFITIVFLSAVFVVMLTLSALTPLIADDFNYAFNWSYNDSLIRIDNYKLLWDSMAAHRYYTHGRVLAQGLVSLFLMWPRWIFFAANAFLVTAFSAALIHFYSRNGVEKPLRATACVLALCWICMPAFGQIFLWLDGACNYFWAAGFAFILLEGVFSLQQGKAKTARMLLLLPLSFAVGSWSEHISFAALMIQSLYLFWLWKNEKKLLVRESLLLLGGCGGYLYLMMAPSMLPSILKDRAREAAESHAQTLFSSLASHTWLILLMLFGLAGFVILLKRQSDKQARFLLLVQMALVLCLGAGLCFGIKELMDSGFYDLISSTPVGFLSLMCVFFFALLCALKQKLQDEALRMPLILFFGGLSALIPFSVAMYVPARGFCAPTVFTAIAAVLLLEKTEITHGRVAAKIFAIIFSILFLIGCEDMIAVHHADMERQSAIRQALASDGILVASPYPEKTKYSAQYGLQDLAADEDWPKDMIKEYYGLKEIIVLPENEEG